MELNLFHGGDNDEPISQNTNSVCSVLPDEGTSQLKDSVFDDDSEKGSSF